MTAKSFTSLEDQLASVMEGEGISVLSADGVRFMRAPTTVEIGKGGSRKRRRARHSAGSRSSKSGASYAGRPAVSPLAADRMRDAVADLDRVVVGFGQAGKPGGAGPGRSMPVAIRQAEHARSPYVVSLRGLVLSRPKKTADERLPQAVLGRSEMPLGRALDLGTIAALASDLRFEGFDRPAVREQFTPTSFEAAYALSYGPLEQWAQQVLACLGELADRFRRLGPVIRPGRRSRACAGRARTVFRPQWSFARAALGVGALLGIAALPAYAVRFARSFELTRAAVTSAGRDALGEIKLAAHKPLPAGVIALRRASARFRQADDALSGANSLALGLATLVPKTRASYRTARALTEAGAKSADAAALLAQGLLGALTGAERTPLERLDVMAAYAQGALPLLDDATAAGARVEAGVLPEAERAKAAELAERVAEGRLAVRDFVGLATLLGDVLGRAEQRRYLVLFQNPSELRPTGGFIGSYAELKLDRGEIKNLTVPAGGTYDLQGQLVARIAPPAPLALIADRWELQDANWSPDFRAAASKIRYFWSQSGGPTVDGVIAVNATLVPKLLALTGPVELPELGKTITAGNFLLETQKAVELEYDRAENKPKKILGLLAPKLIERLKALPQDRWLSIFGVLQDALATKDIQVSFSASDEDALAERFGWNGRLKTVNGDALAVVDANIAGQKTDLAIEETVDHAADIKPNGSVLDTVTLTRRHTASKGELFRGVRNVTYVRFYVPRGSTLLDARGFRSPDPKLFQPPREDVTPDPDEANKTRTLVRHPSGLEEWDEGERTVFGGWSLVDPGNSVVLRVTYRLPFSAFDIRERLQTGPASEDPAPSAALGAGSGGAGRAAYSLLLTSQSGKSSRRLTSSVKLPEGWQTRWERPKDGVPETWDSDRVYAALYDIQTP